MTSQCLYAALLLAFAIPARAQLRSAEHGRPIVLIVHGRGQFGRDTALLRREALVALQQGALRLGTNPFFNADDVQLVWYADVLSASAAATPSGECSRAGTSSRIGTADTTVNAVSLIASVATAFLDVLSAGANSDDMSELRSVAGDLRFFSDPVTRCAAEDRVGEALGRANAAHRPVLLAAHSLGALVTWHFLTRPRADERSRPQVARWVTMGSPLGSIELRQLAFGDAQETLTVPKNVGSWINVLGDGDPLAARVASPEVEGDDGTTFRDIRTEALHDEPHQLLSYLADPATVRAIIGGWCNALPAVERTTAAACTIGAARAP